MARRPHRLAFWTWLQVRAGLQLEGRSGWKGPGDVKHWHRGLACTQEVHGVWLQAEYRWLQRGWQVESVVMELSGLNDTRCS